MNDKRKLEVVLYFTADYRPGVCVTRGRHEKWYMNPTRSSVARCVRLCASQNPTPHITPWSALFTYEA